MITSHTIIAMRTNLIVACILVGTATAFLPVSKSSSTLVANLPAISVDLRAIDATGPSADENTTVEFPPPLSRVERLGRAARFWSVAVPLVANYYGKYAEMKIRSELLGEQMSEDQVEVSSRNAKLRHARRIN
jgi:hypothetical protein